MRKKLTWRFIRKVVTSYKIYNLEYPTVMDYKDAIGVTSLEQLSVAEFSGE